MFEVLRMKWKNDKKKLQVYDKRVRIIGDNSQSYTTTI